MRMIDTSCQEHNTSRDRRKKFKVWRAQSKQGETSLSPDFLLSLVPHVFLSLLTLLHRHARLTQENTIEMNEQMKPFLGF